MSKEVGVAKAQDDRVSELRYFKSAGVLIILAPHLWAKKLKTCKKSQTQVL